MKTPKTMKTGIFVHNRYVPVCSRYYETGKSVIVVRLKVAQKNEWPLPA